MVIGDGVPRIPASDEVAHGRAELDAASRDAGAEPGVALPDHEPAPTERSETGRSGDPGTTRHANTASPFRIVDRARWSDVDAAGIVRYDAYLRFFMVAETELFRASGLTVTDFHEHFGLWLARRRIECDYYRPILLDEEVEVFVHLVALGRSSLELAFYLRRLGERELAAEGRYVLVAIDHQGLRSAPLPEPAREALGPWVMGREAVLAASRIQG